MSNIRESVAMSVMAQVNALTFCAHDEKEHIAYYSPKIGSWVIENNEGFSWPCCSMAHALGLIEVSACVQADNFTVIHKQFI